MILQNVRCSFVNIFVPKLASANATSKVYSMCVMVPKADKVKSKMIFDAQAKAVAVAIEKGKFSVAQSKSPKFRNIIRDGDAEFKAEERGPEFQGFWFFNANRYENNGAPDVVMKDPESGELVSVIDPKICYSGAFYHVDMQFYGHNNNGPGIACGLNNVMFAHDGPRLDGRMSAEQAFGDLPAGVDEAEDPEVSDELT